MRAGHVAACVAARRHIHATSRQTRVPPVVDGSNISSFYYRVWCCWSVHHFERAWSADTGRLKPFLWPTLRKNMLQEEILYEECVDYKFVE